ncbi:hypothetical protein BMF94_0656 [Rhodotorula taiwanensis]|uniref:AP complex subunit sigma n=1 Tax=Rhodotorula taiwanensis TaxID=741276 RepID=A0A2S5BI72_9BASI|nr:hypothetical protein BMF94_0656 [Rhodotorula taiwanensis]
MSTGLQERDNGLSFFLLISRQGKVRLSKWYTTMSPKNKAKIVKDVTQLVLARRTRMCNFLEYKDSKIVYRRYASLFFICGIGQSDNELITLELIHRRVGRRQDYRPSVSRPRSGSDPLFPPPHVTATSSCSTATLATIFNYEKAYTMLDELIIAGEMQESSKKSVLRAVGQADALEEQELAEDPLARLSGR